MWETWVWFLGWEDPLEKGKAIHSSSGVTKSQTQLSDIHFHTFPVVMYRCESWPIKKAEGWRTDAFELWCWRKLLRVLWTAKRSNQSFLKEINPEYSLKDWCWSSNTLATWCKVLTHWKRPWCWGKMGGRRRRGKQRIRWLDVISISYQFSCSVLSNSSRSHGLQHARLPCPSPTPRAYSNSCPSSQWCPPTISSLMGSQRVRHDWATKHTYMHS